MPFILLICLLACKHGQQLTVGDGSRSPLGLEEAVATLGSLDDMLGLLRPELADLTPSDTKAPAQKPKKHDYQPLLDSKDLDKAKRLVTARERSIKSVKALLAKAKEKASTAAGNESMETEPTAQT